MVNEIKTNSNKEIALSFLRFVVAGKIREGYERFVAKELSITTLIFLEIENPC